MRLLLLGLFMAAGIVCAGEPKPCVFCEIVAGRTEAAVVYRDERVVAFMDIAPHNPGHVLVVPVQHADDILTVPTDTAEEMMVVAQRSARAIRKAGLKADGFNFRMNAGAAAGQTVFHAHLHVVPRFVGDEGGDRHPQGKLPLSELEPIAAKIRAQLE
jgi:histidine triad (HIT) family protein